ncbi:MAG: ABC transporter permease [Elusimicrobia bacterium]|nr:ABC transporter permease [Elusimicrobiota bacterium]
MFSYIKRRLIMLPLVAVGVTFLLFSLTNLLSPEMRASLYIKDPRQLDHVEEVIKEHGLRDPLLKQYGKWLINLAHGDMGYSETAGMAVSQAIKTYLPATIELALIAMAAVLFFGTWLGVLSAVKKGKFADHLARVIAIIGYSMPSFVIGLVLLMVFYGKFRMFSPGRYGMETDLIIHSAQFTRYSGFLLIDSIANGQGKVFLDILSHLVLPSAALCFGTMALLTRVTRSSMLEELGKDYIRTARAKGLPENDVIRKHALPNALIPVITLASLQFVRMLGGVVITETIFDFPGIGRWGVMSAQRLDVPGVLGFALMTSCLFVMGNLLSDLLYAAVDPRIRVK